MKNTHLTLTFGFFLLILFNTGCEKNEIVENEETVTEQTHYLAVEDDYDEDDAEFDATWELHNTLPEGQTVMTAFSEDHFFTEIIEIDLDPIPLKADWSYTKRGHRKACRHARDISRIIGCAKVMAFTDDRGRKRWGVFPC